MTEQSYTQQAEAAFNEFISTEHGQLYLESEMFQRRGTALMQRLEHGEPMSVAAAAEMVGLPLLVFAYSFGSFLAYAASMVSEKPATMH